MSHSHHMAPPGGQLQVFAHHFGMGTGLFKDLIKLSDLSQVRQQVRDKARNAVQTILGPRANASGCDLKIRICQVSCTAHSPGISRNAPSLSPSLHQLLRSEKLTLWGLMVKEKVPTPF